MNGRLLRTMVVIAAGITGTSLPGASHFSSSADSCIAHVPEAATRSGLSPDTIMRVMMAESGGDGHAISPKGAMGCMQIMPATWAMLTARHGLGINPYDARANMIAGSLYLAELARRYGFPGAYAAYNAGGAHWLRHRYRGAPLPAETIAYMARTNAAEPEHPGEAPRPRWQEAGLFVKHVGSQSSRTVNGKKPGTSAPLPTLESALASEPSSLFPLDRPRLVEKE